LKPENIKMRLQKYKFLEYKVKFLFLTKNPLRKALSLDKTTERYFRTALIKVFLPAVVRCDSAQAPEVSFRFPPGAAQSSPAAPV